MTKYLLVLLENDSLKWVFSVQQGCIRKDEGTIKFSFDIRRTKEIFILDIFQQKS